MYDISHKRRWLIFKPNLPTISLVEEKYFNFSIQKVHPRKSVVSAALTFFLTENPSFQKILRLTKFHVIR